MTRLLHLSDVHLGGATWGRSHAHRMRLHEALRTSFTRAMDCALREEVDAVLVAGNLYDQEHLSVDIEQFLYAQLRRLHDAGIPFVALSGTAEREAAGAREPLVGPDSFYQITGEEPETIDLPDTASSAAVRVVAQRLSPRSDAKEVLLPDPPKAADAPTVGLFYGEGEKQLSLRTESGTPVRECYDYLALGGRHQRAHLPEGVPGQYAGSLFGRRPQHTGPKGGLLVTLERDASPTVSFRAFAPLTWRQLRLDELVGVRTRSSLRRHVIERLPAQRYNLMLHLVLAGASPLARILADPARRRAWEGPLADRLGVVCVQLDTTELAFPPSPQAHRGNADVLGEVLALIDEVDADEETRDAMASPNLLTACPEDMDPQEYVHRLLKDLNREAVDRLTKQ